MMHVKCVLTLLIATLATACTTRNVNILPIAASDIGTATSLVPLETTTQVTSTPCATPNSPPRREPAAFAADLSALGPNAQFESMMVGYTVWTETEPNCYQGRKTMFRGNVSFHLAPIQGTSRPGDPYARQLDKALLVVGVQPTGAATQAGPFSCPASIGGLAAVYQLQPGVAVDRGFHGPNSEFGLFPLTETQPLQDVTGMTAGETRGRATASSANPGMLTIEIDVTDATLAAIRRGDAQLGFALAGVNEQGRLQQGNPNFSALPISQDVQFDCRTIVRSISLLTRSK